MARLPSQTANMTPEQLADTGNDIVQAMVRMLPEQMHNLTVSQLLGSIALCCSNGDRSRAVSYLFDALGMVQTEPVTHFNKGAMN